MNTHFTDNWIRYFREKESRALYYYLAIFIAVGIFFSLLSWVINFNEVGEWVSEYFILGTWFVELLFINQFLVSAGENALAKFRPLLNPDVDFVKIENDFTTIPASRGNFAFLLGLSAGVAITTYAWGNIDLALNIPLMFGWITAGFGFAMTMIAAYRITRQLSVARRLLNDIPTLNMYDLNSLYGFSLFPLEIVLLNAVFLWANPALLIFPDLFQDSNLVVIFIAFSLLPGIAIIPTFSGVRKRLLKEKESLLRENSLRVQNSSTKLYELMDQEKIRDLRDFEKGINSLFVFRREIQDISAWPWSPDIIRWIATALILPIGVWMIQLLLSRILGV